MGFMGLVYGFIGPRVSGVRGLGFRIWGLGLDFV